MDDDDGKKWRDKYTRPSKQSKRSYTHLSGESIRSRKHFRFTIIVSWYFRLFEIAPCLCRIASHFLRKICFHSVNKMADKMQAANWLEFNDDIFKDGVFCTVAQLTCIQSALSDWKNICVRRARNSPELIATAVMCGGSGTPAEWKCIASVFPRNAMWHATAMTIIDHTWHRHNHHPKTTWISSVTANAEHSH